MKEIVFKVENKENQLAKVLWVCDAISIRVSDLNLTDYYAYISELVSECIIILIGTFFFISAIYVSRNINGYYGLKVR